MQKLGSKENNIYLIKTINSFQLSKFDNWDYSVKRGFKGRCAKTSLPQYAPDNKTTQRESTSYSIET